MSYPWNVHGFIFSRFPGDVFKRGTGTLVGKRSVITAAHCLYLKEKTAHGYKYTPAKETYFFSGLKGKESLYSSKVLKELVHPKYLQNDSLYDYGLVKLEDNIGAKTGYASLIVAEDAELDDQTVNVTGYPGYVGAFRHLIRKDTFIMYTSSGQIKFVDKHMIRYHIDTSGGQSGSGVWALNKEDIVECCGVHIMGSKLEGNGAIRINDENFETIQNWLKKFESDT
ncbi:MAG: hypothetical protein BGO67_00640 [Alphaproteobacteria bacterium 41-28]|jgi:glutamyl endopeptidase|nr:MAG: hypothetical protein BGO67_00640 [Alphaproteobacteria bacterium 41-28]